MHVTIVVFVVVVVINAATLMQISNITHIEAFNLTTGNNLTLNPRIISQIYSNESLVHLKPQAHLCSFLLKQ